MWWKEALMAVIGVSCGLSVAGGLFALIIALGLVAKLLIRRIRRGTFSGMRMRWQQEESWEILSASTRLPSRQAAGDLESLDCLQESLSERGRWRLRRLLISFRLLRGGLICEEGSVWRCFLWQQGGQQVRFSFTGFVFDGHFGKGHRDYAGI